MSPTDPPNLTRRAPNARNRMGGGAVPNRSGWESGIRVANGPPKKSTNEPRTFEQPSFPYISDGHACAHVIVRSRTGILPPNTQLRRVGLPNRTPDPRTPRLRLVGLPLLNQDLQTPPFASRWVTGPEPQPPNTPNCVSLNYRGRKPNPQPPTPCVSLNDLFAWLCVCEPIWPSRIPLL